MFGISIDTDWAVQQVIDDVRKILNEFKIQATFFLTNKIDTTNLNNHELGIHPNYEGETNYESIIQKTLEYLPNKSAKGVRSHKLFYTTSLPTIYKKYGIEYDSNYILPSYESVKPFFIPNSDILEIPFVFGDDQLFSNNTKMKIQDLPLKDSGVKVFMFHPIHIFMNTDSTETYLKFKKYNANFDKLNEIRDHSRTGIRSIFLDFLDGW